MLIDWSCFAHILCRVKKKGRSVPQTDIGGAERGAEGGTEEDAEGNSADLTAVSTSRGTVMVTNIELVSNDYNDEI